MKIQIIALTISLTSPYAAHAYGDCVVESITPLNVGRAVVRQCYLADPLEESTVFQDYPNLVDNPRTVQYWKGAYGKDVTETSVFLRQLVDTCRGEILDSRNITTTKTYTKLFDVSNPNLDPSIKEDHMLLPMTPGQADDQLEVARQNCMDDVVN